MSTITAEGEAEGPAKTEWGHADFMPIAAPNKLWGIDAQNSDWLQHNHRRVLVDLMRIFIALRLPNCLWGPPGARKTRTIEALAHEVDQNGVPYQVITIQPSTEDPTVIHGLKYTSLDPDSGETVMLSSLPDVVKQIIDHYDNHHGLTILFLDEMTTCMPAQQHALLGLLTHGKYGDRSISDYTSIVMAANPENTVSMVNPLGEQVINRGAHIPWYGDMNLFLEEWSSGWSGTTTPPSTSSVWYMTNMMMEAPSEVFRSDKWKPQDLVPYDLFENSERSMTEWNRAITLVNDLFENSEQSVRHYYLIEVTRAVLGNNWADRMALVCAREDNKVSGEHIIDNLKRLGIQRDWTPEQLTAADPNFLLWTDPNGQVMKTDQYTFALLEMMDRLRTNGYDPTIATSIWAMASRSPSQAHSSSLHMYLVECAIMGIRAVKAHRVDHQEGKTPDFVPADVRERIKPALVRELSLEG